MRILDEIERLRFERLLRLKELLTVVPSRPVTLVGDVMLDRFHHGTSEGLSSSAPVPSLKITDTEESPGAAAHIALSLVSLGAEVRMFSAVGSDDEGNFVLDAMSDAGVDASSMLKVDDWETLTKIRFFGSREGLVDRTQMMMQADRGLETLPPKFSALLVNEALLSLSDSSALVISDYDHGVITDAAAESLIGEARSANVPVIADPKLSGLDRVTGATVALFEARGVELMRRRGLQKEESETISHLFESFGWEAMIVLGGVDGTTLHTADGGREHFECRAPTTSQQLGLHDAAATALALALGQGRSMVDAACLANAACECVLSQSTSEAFVSRESLSLWLDEVAWQMQVSER